MSRIFTSGRLASIWAAMAVVVSAWLMLCAPVMASDATAYSTDGASNDAAEVVRALIAAVDRGDSPGPAIQAAAPIGMAAALEAVKRLDDRMPARRTAGHDLIALVSRCRGWPEELLRTYDPIGHATFYGDKGFAFERDVARCLTWDQWAPATADVLVRAAPRPTLEWLKTQATADRPSSDRVAALCRAWGAWARQGRESQYGGELAAVAALLLGSRVLMATDLRPGASESEPAAAAIVRLAGDARSTAATTALAGLAAGAQAADTRGAACAALGRMESAPALAALAAVLRSETDSRVLVDAAAALDHWPVDARAGAALFEVFQRVKDPAVRRSIGFTSIRARWPQRRELISLAVADSDGSVVGVALQAVAARSEPAAADIVIDLARSFRVAQPSIIDALGALGDTRGSDPLARWLKTETNPALRAKLVVALRLIGDANARSALADVVRRDTTPLVIEQAILGVEALGMADLTADLLALSSDRTAPMGPRLQAIRALSRFGTTEVKEHLEALWRSADDMFAERGAGAPATRTATTLARDNHLRGDDRVMLGRFYIAVAQARLGDAAAAARVQRVYDAAAATARFHGLWLLGSLKVDHAIVDQALESDDLAVLAAAVRAAGVVRPRSRRAALDRLDRSPWIRMISGSSIDSLNIKDRLHEALQASLRPATQP